MSKNIYEKLHEAGILILDPNTGTKHTGKEMNTRRVKPKKKSKP